MPSHVVTTPVSRAGARCLGLPQVCPEAPCTAPGAYACMTRSAHRFGRTATGPAHPHRGVHEVPRCPGRNQRPGAKCHNTLRLRPAPHYDNSPGAGGLGKADGPLPTGPIVVPSTPLIVVIVACGSCPCCHNSASEHGLHSPRVNPRVNITTHGRNQRVPRPFGDASSVTTSLSSLPKGPSRAGRIPGYGGFGGLRDLLTLRERTGVSPISWEWSSSAWIDGFGTL